MARVHTLFTTRSYHYLNVNYVIAYGMMSTVRWILQVWNVLFYGRIIKNLKINFITRLEFDN